MENAISTVNHDHAGCDPQDPGCEGGDIINNDEEKQDTGSRDDLKHTKA